MGKPKTIDELDIEAELARFETEERARLGLEGAGLEGGGEHWTDEMTAPLFTAGQRAKTTLLVGGLTMAHDYLVEGALRGIGYEVRALDVADEQALRAGKEYGNRAQCNPTYFTVGNLVKELIRLRDEEGLSSEAIVRDYAFLTAGACGPCRFGMYVTEYRKALRDAGFEGFRVLLFQQTGGFKQATGEELGLVLNPTFFFSLGKALFSGDVINLMQYRLRPFEVVPGSVDEAIAAVKKEVYDALVARTSVIAALWRGRKILRALELDRLQAKPTVAIIGEFWAMTTEGDGNYHLQRFLEEEGAEVNIQVVANTLLYNLWEFRHDTLSRAELRGADESKFGLEGTDLGLTMAGLFAGELALRVVFQTFAKVLGLHGHVLPDMDEVAAVGHSHYNVELRGGEGHLEVAKLILNVAKQKAHMTLSVKPFGCMPSSGVSDGVQSVVTELYPDAIFCPVETSGDGAVNFYSRVQMYLFKARQRAREELASTLESYGVSEEEVRAFVKGTRYGATLHHAPHVTAGTAADLVHEVAPLMSEGPLGRAKVRAGRLAASAKKLVTVTLPKRARKMREVAPFLPSLARFAASELSEKVSASEAWSRVFDRATKLSEEEERQVAEALAASEAAPAPSAPRQSLPIV
ncbi:MAG TPA: 2-hydroxyglutaryl-CoA dehydratase [Polyangiaceae bacterium LLY-WYZ-15_(1-7)]|nr:2-hydroxyglutaryl-CoA dehydratase [Polyangiaceae bacterium LLY-WYZ-15_(1-7)]